MTQPIDLYYWPTPNGWKITIALEEMGLRVFTSRTSQRVAYAETMAEGVTVFEGVDEKAIQEINEITNELLEWQNGIH